MLMEERLKTARESYVLLWHSCRHVPNMETQYRYLYIADHIMVLLQIYIVVMERLDNLVIGEVLKWWEKKRGKNWLHFSDVGRP